MEGAWAELNDYVVEFLSKPEIMETFVDIIVCVVPIWAAVMIGLLIGWSWRPRWTGLVFLGFRSKFRFLWTVPLGLGARRFWFAFTALSAFSVCRGLWFRFQGRNRKVSAQEPASSALEASVATQEEAGDDLAGHAIGIVNGDLDRELSRLTEKDLEHLLHLLDGKDGEMSWQSMMERSTSNLTYQAWRHEPEVQLAWQLDIPSAQAREVPSSKICRQRNEKLYEVGPIVYRSKTIFEDATPELVRDFFWDDEFRPKWDPMLVYVKILEECHDTGMMIVHWIKKFPFFCSDREYIIGRRIWESGKSNYCVTKGVPYPALPKRDKPRLVDFYFSSWVIKPVESRKLDGQLSACEVTLIHYEDMGIPKDVAKLGVRHGMWGTVKRLHAGFRAYQNARKFDTSLTRCALMARITTKISCEEGTDLVAQASDEERKNEVVKMETPKESGGIDWKWVAIGGTVALICGLRTGLIGRALLVGAGHRIARRRGNRR